MSTQSSDFEQMQDRIDDVLRSNLRAITSVCEDDDDFETPPDNAILGDWITVIQVIDPADGTNFYFRSNSRGMARHARAGLLAMFTED